ncbi:MAG: carboxypeptidase-like regulatory domain-containing protein [Pyrinomonadaceae bacterium]
MLLTGIVYDQNGAVIVASRVVAYGSDGKEYETSTNSDGIYELQLPLGTYEVEASALHFCPTLVKGFAVVNSTYRKMSKDFVLVVRDSKCENERPKKRKQRGSERKKDPIGIIE